jgi:ribonuclease T
MEPNKCLFSGRFRSYLPVIVDIETAGFDPKHHAVLEIAAVLLEMDESGRIAPSNTVSCHVVPFEGSKLDRAALEFNGIDPFHPFRFAVDEHHALKTIFDPIRKALKSSQCTRAILVGHNPAFDIAFLNAAVERTGIKKNPFHPFCTFDTATLCGLAFGQTVLARAAKAAGHDWNTDEAHSAKYDAWMTATLFCQIVNRWEDLCALENARPLDASRDTLA